MDKREAKVFDGKKKVKLGTEKNPARVRVKTKKRMGEVAAIFEQHGWQHVIEVAADQPEDVADLEMLLDRPKPVAARQKVGRNDPCPCGSGRKHKKCCGR